MQTGKAVNAMDLPESEITGKNYLQCGESSLRLRKRQLGADFRIIF